MPKSVCSFYLANSCRKGDSCTFSHGQQPRVICKHHRLGTCTFGDGCRNSHDLTEVGVTSTEIACTFWKRGICSKGDQCPFLHESVARPSNSTSWRESQWPTVDPAVNAQLMSESPSCMYWKSGNCLKGTQCRFSHDPPVQSDYVPPTRKHSFWEKNGEQAQ